MKIIYNKNPLRTTVELDEIEKKEFWYKIKINEMTNLLYEAHFFLEENLEKVKKAVDPEYYSSENNELDKRCDLLLEQYLNDLQDIHVGDCTCVAMSCSKCHAESILGIDTIPGLKKHSSYKIDGAFGKNNEKTIEEAIESLKNYKVNIENPKEWDRLGGYEQYIPRWMEEAKDAHDWLVDYKNRHFG
jgi:hypothetical protein